MSEMSRTEQLLAMLVLQGMSGLTVQEKALRFRSVGLTNAEIAEMLGTTPQVVAQSVYESKQKRVRGTAKAKRRKP